jgi:hypothetical protein
MDLFSRPCECVFSFELHPITEPPTLESAALAAFQYWSLDIMPLLSGDLYFKAVVTSFRQTTPPTVFRVDLDPPIRGGYAGPSLPANVAVRLGVEVAYPPGHWRSCIFLPGVPSPIVDGNTLQQAWRASLDDVASNLIDRASHSGWRWVVAAQQLDGAPAPADLRYRVTRVHTLTPWVSQRRRRLRNEPRP